MTYIVQQIRSTEEGRRPRASQLAEGQFALNVHDASPGIFLKTTEDKVVKVGGVSVSATEPLAIYNNEYSIGELWYSTDTGTLNVFDGSSWTSTATAASTASALVSDRLTTLEGAAALQTSLTVGLQSNLVQAKQYTDDFVGTLMNNIAAKADTTSLSSYYTKAEIDAAGYVTGPVNAQDTLDVITGRGSTTTNDITVGKVYFSNVFPTLGDLPDATTYHGMFAHVHSTGCGYFAHNGNWVKLGNHVDITAATSRITALEADATTKTYVDDEIAALVDSSPGTLNTLGEIAAALGDDANLSTTLTNAIAAVQLDVDQNESASNTAITNLQTALATIQSDVDQNEADAAAAVALSAPKATPVFSGDVTLGNGAFYKAASERLGLGTTAPGGRLHVTDTGGVQAIFQRDGGSSKWVIKNNTADDGITLQSAVQSANAIRFEGYGTGAGVTFDINDNGTVSRKLQVQNDAVTVHTDLISPSIKLGAAQLELSVDGDGDLEFGGVPVMPFTMTAVLTALGVSSYADQAAALLGGLIEGDVYYNTGNSKLTSVTA